MVPTARAPEDDLARAFSTLRPALAAFFERRAGRGAVDDLVQETNFRLERIRPSYDPTRPPEPWIWRIARLVLLEQLRVPRHEHLDTAAEEQATVEACGVDLERVRLEHEETVWTAVRALDDPPRSRLRTCVALHALEGVPHGRLAAALGIGESASKMRVSRGLAALEAILTVERNAWSAGRCEAAREAWSFVRSLPQAVQRTAILGLMARVPAPLRAAVGATNEPVDELLLARADARMCAAGWPE